MNAGFQRSICTFLKDSIAVTPADMDDALLAGAQGYVGTPFDPDDLIVALRTALAQSAKDV